MRMLNYSKCGFTLIEVIIIIAIIGVLAAIAVPAYRSYVSESQSSACLLEVKSYSNDILYILNDHDDSSFPIAPATNACQFITDATGWTLRAQQKIIAIAKPPSNVRIECDIPKGSPCRVLP